MSDQKAATPKEAPRTEPRDLKPSPAKTTTVKGGLKSTVENQSMDDWPKHNT